MSTPTLNQGQQAAVDSFFAFLMDENQKEMIISGPGGVGKSFTVAQMIDTVMPMYFDNCKLLGLQPMYRDVVVTATTNKAAEVLTKSMGYPAQTIHSYMCLRVTEDHVTGEVKLKPNGNYEVKQNTIIFIDEYSMICHNLRRFLKEGVSKTCKIVYVGDHAQLAPVMESEIEIAKRGLPTSHLTQPMRTDVPALQKLNEHLRNCVETGTKPRIELVPGIIELYDDAQMEAAIQNDFVNQNGNVRILAYSNKKVQEYNDYVRWLRKLDAEPHTGELLVCNSAVKLGSGKNMKMIPTECELEVTGVNRTEEVIVQGIDGSFSLECYNVDVQSTYSMFSNVLVPTDKAHWQALIKYYAKLKDWPTYFKLKQEFADLRPRDASTVHKAQGSSFDHIYMDLSDISKCTQFDMALRLLYVAASRARNKVILYGNLAERIGEIVDGICDEYPDSIG